MKKINETQTQYDSLIEFGILGKDNEMINLKTLIATKKDKKTSKK